ncbi:MAG TPA: gamma-glutamyl-gamma-aminobutyrate hydrolase family protein [Anaeromyxobacteraceae bacterium]|nr:gamma-glutamyl-gamma-aminobutyrate hydrolase family protein [Anaeromyxobacteraceae bacterium]
MRPRIGLTLDMNADGTRYDLPRSYADAIRDAGGLPYTLPFGPPGDAREVLDDLDGLVISGGAFDIPPERYGDERRDRCGPSRPERTDFEWALCSGALARGMPLLGICGGMQLLNVVCGGSLHQDVPDELGVEGHQQPPPKDEPAHAVEIAPGSLLARLCGTDRLRVNSTHHQAVKAAGEGLRITAYALDGIVEAVESTTHGFALGVQWHPESLRREARHLAIYRGVVDAASAWRGRG